MADSEEEEIDCLCDDSEVCLFFIFIWSIFSSMVIWFAAMNEQYGSTKCAGATSSHRQGIFHTPVINVSISVELKWKYVYLYICICVEHLYVINLFPTAFSYL